MTPIATATNTAGTPIEVGEGARAIVITPDGKTAYVVVWGEPGTVTPIATATNTAGTPIEVGDGPYTNAITPGASPSLTCPPCGVARRAPGGASQGQSPPLTSGQRRRQAPP